MRIDAIGYNHKHNSKFLINRPYGSGNYLLLLIKTSAVFRISNEDIYVAPNSFLLYTPDYPQYYYAETNTYIDDWLHFMPENENETRLISELNIPLNKPVNVSDMEQISSLIKYMIYENNSGNCHYRKTINCCFEILMYKLSEAVSQEPKYLKPKLFMDNASFPEQKVIIIRKMAEIRHTIYSFPSKEWRAKDMARELSISESYFQHLYKKIFGISINKDMMKARAEKQQKCLQVKNISQ